MITYAKNEMIAARDHAKKWKKGDVCMAPFAEDGKYYEATIGSLDIYNISCEVVFTGYDTKENVKIADLLSEDDVEWEGEAGKFSDETPAVQEAVTDKNNLKSFFSGVLPAIPLDILSDSDILSPPSTLLFDSAICADDQKTAKKNVLMSYFMAGYRTGYYMAISGGKMNNEKVSDPQKKETNE